MQNVSGLSPEEVVMIGDDVRDDVAGAQGVGIKGCLVQTGKYMEGDERNVVGQNGKVIQPDYVFPSFAKALDLFQHAKNKAQS
jgi:ribonucleotide monophosphatase NagD (HAD superfamily)